MRMRFAQRPNSRCPPSRVLSHSTHLALDILQTGCNSLEFCLCVREFSRIPTIPAEIRTSPFSMRSLLTTEGSGRFCPEAGSPEAGFKVSLQMANTQKTAIITGASRGIGAGLVEAFLKRGYSVVANSRHITKANPFAASANLALVDGDIGHPSTAATIVDTAVSRFGRIDVLINNAGVFIPKPFTEYTTEDFNAL